MNKGKWRRLVAHLRYLRVVYLMADVLVAKLAVIGGILGFVWMLFNQKFGLLTVSSGLFAAHYIWSRKKKYLQKELRMLVGETNTKVVSLIKLRAIYFLYAVVIVIMIAALVPGQGDEALTELNAFIIEASANYVGGMMMNMAFTLIPSFSMGWLFWKTTEEWPMRLKSLRRIVAGAVFFLSFILVISLAGSPYDTFWPHSYSLGKFLIGFIPFTLLKLMFWSNAFVEIRNDRPWGKS